MIRPAFAALLAGSSPGGCRGGSPAWVSRCRRLPHVPAALCYMRPPPCAAAAAMGLLPGAAAVSSIAAPIQNCAGMMAEAYFVFSIGNLKGIFKAQYPT